MNVLTKLRGGNSELGLGERRASRVEPERSKNMNVVATHIVYLIVSLILTVWVARSLSKNGRVFLVDSFGANEELADSVNDLLVVGFYLNNAGYVTLALRYGEKPHTLVDSIEFLSTKTGLVLVVLGGMHFFNMYVIARLRRRFLAGDETAPAIEPTPAAEVAG
jgi:hypothetical protein